MSDYPFTTIPFIIERPFRRVFFSAGLATIAASVCYPKAAVDLTLTNFEKVKGFVNEQRMKYNQPVSESDKMPVETDEAKPAEPKTAPESTEGGLWNKIPSLDKMFGSQANKEADVSVETLNKVQQEKDKIVKMETTPKQTDGDVEVKGDSGMSNPEDKDLYSTRS